ncbi:MAG: hypothetical protein ACFBSF_16630 [Leptolyngbyaceae cyanobacterium]
MTKKTKNPEDRFREKYDTVADTVGLLPNIRLQDNVIQGIVIITSTGLAMLIGGLSNGIVGLAIGSIVGLICSLLVSGFVLMLLGWIRTIKKISKRK